MFYKDENYIFRGWNLQEVGIVNSICTQPDDLEYLGLFQSHSRQNLGRCHNVQPSRRTRRRTDAHEPVKDPEGHP